jgi:hypothetical protein
MPRSFNRVGYLPDHADAFGHTDTDYGSLIGVASQSASCL